MIKRLLQIALLSLALPAGAQIIAPIVVPPGKHGRLNSSATMAYWDSSHMWIDVLKADFQPWLVGYTEPHPYNPEASIFRGPDAAGMEAAKDLYDANGYLTELPDIYEEPNLPAIHTFGFVDQKPGDSSWVGRYVLIWEGDAEVEVSNRQPGSIANMVESANRIEFDLVQQPGGFEFLGITVTEINPMDYLRDMHMYKLEYEDEFENGQVVSPLWIEHYGNLQSMRFMDMTMTNGYGGYLAFGPTIGHYNTWANRAHPDDFSWGIRGIPIEAVVAFGNETGINVWYTIPFFSFDAPWSYCDPPCYTYPTGPITDPEDFTRPLAEYVEANLSPEVVFHVEMGNELWNFAFVAAQRLEGERQSDETWGPTGGASGGSWQEYFSARYAVPNMDVFADVFEGQMHRIKRMGCVQGAYFQVSDWFFDAPTWWTANEGGNVPPYEHFDALCWNAYFYPQVAYVEELIDRLEDPMYTDEDVREWYAQLFYDHIDGTGAVAYIDSLTSQMLHKDSFANARGLDVYLYEGGRHNTFGGGSSNDGLVYGFLNEWNVSEEAGEVYAHWLNVWEGDKPPDVYKHGMMQFNLITREDARTPFWAARWIGDSNPVIDTLLDYNAGLIP